MLPISYQSLNGPNSGSRGPREEIKKENHQVLHGTPKCSTDHGETKVFLWSREHNWAKTIEKKLSGLVTRRLYFKKRTTFWPNSCPGESDPYIACPRRHSKSIGLKFAHNQQLESKRQTRCWHLGWFPELFQLLLLSLQLVSSLLLLQFKNPLLPLPRKTKDNKMVLLGRMMLENILMRKTVVLQVERKRMKLLIIGLSRRGQWLQAQMLVSPLFSERT